MIISDHLPYNIIEFLYFIELIHLEARVVILTEKGSLFGRFEDTKISFWDYLAFL